MFLGRLHESLFPQERWLAAGHAALAGRPIAVLSSRVGRKFELYHEWFERLNRLLQRPVTADRILLTCRDATCHRYVKSAAATRRLASVECQLPSPRQSFAQWITSLDIDKSSTRRARMLRVSPPARVDVSGELPLLEPWPLADRLLATLAQELYVLFVRPGGNLERLISYHLDHPPPWPQRWLLVDDRRWITPALVQRWEGRGAEVWNHAGDGRRVETTRGDASPPKTTKCVIQPATGAAQGHVKCVVPLNKIPPEMYLAHWTRRQPGPWPDESEANYIESLLADPQARDRSPLASLLRIVRRQRLIATHRLTRGSTKVVCFTGRPLGDFLKRRTFRSMHARWDFEPYGICIDRQWMIGRGARPVIYGDEATWQRLSADDRPYFQFRGTASGRGALDWSDEDEWRHVGDVELAWIPPELVLVFVPDEASASAVSAAARWPVTVLGGPPSGAA